MKWKTPPIIKIYEALGSVADDRITISENSNEAKVYSSSGNKFYDVTYDAKKKAIMTNDNGSYWKGYLGYPSIAFLLKTGVLPYDKKFGDALKGIAWKDINTQFKNDFDKTQKYCDNIMKERGVDEKEFATYLETTMSTIEQLSLSLLGKKTLPPEGY